MRAALVDPSASGQFPRTSNAPLVSIGMPVRDCAKTLELSLRSIIDQTYPHWELLLIDDGSSDDTAELATSLAVTDRRIRFYRHGQCLSTSVCLNEAITASRGTFFARMDAQGVAYPRRLERQVAYLSAHPEVDFVGAWAIAYSEDGRVLGKRANSEQHEEICRKPAAGLSLIAPTCLGRIDVFRRFGYRASASDGGDHDLLLRACGIVSEPAMTSPIRRRAGAPVHAARIQPSSRFANVPEILHGCRSDQSDLGKITRSRFSFLTTSFQGLWREGRRLEAFRSASVDAVQGIGDTVASGAGRNDRLARNHLLSTTEDEWREWREVWSALQSKLKGAPTNG
jgi:glycosyltransferase involved in cell wall biosynthesis